MRGSVSERERARYIYRERGREIYIEREREGDIYIEREGGKVYRCNVNRYT